MLEIWTSMWVKMAVTHFVTLFRHFGVYSGKKKKKRCLVNTVLKMWYQICKKKSLCVQKNTFIKSAKKKCKKQTNMKAFTIFGGF